MSDIEKKIRALVGEAWAVGELSAKGMLNNTSGAELDKITRKLLVLLSQEIAEASVALNDIGIEVEAAINKTAQS